MKNNIILIGFMGCGKTSTGIRLSYALRRTLIDTDKWIEKKQKMSISELFASKGEACFRKMETDCIRELIRTEDNRIIATGGGLPPDCLQNLGVFIISGSHRKLCMRD